MNDASLRDLEAELEDSPEACCAEELEEACCAEELEEGEGGVCECSTAS